MDGDLLNTNEWVEIKSSSIDAVFYDTTAQTLKVKFTGGTTYEYTKVDFKTFKNLIYSGSSGNYLRQHIATKHEGRKVPDGDNIIGGEAGNPLNQSGPADQP